MIDWSSIFNVMVRTIIVFLFTFLMMRLRGKKQLAQLNIFDIIIIIALGSAVGDVMIYPEATIPLFNALTGIATIIILVLIVENLLAVAPTSVLKLIEGSHEIIVENGKVRFDTLRKVNIHEEELKSKLRAKGIHSYSQLKTAYLEPDGSISIIKKRSINGHLKKRL